MDRRDRAGEGVASASAIAVCQEAVCRTSRNGQGLPARDGPGVLSGLRIVEHTREQTAQLDRGSELAALFEDGADRGGLCLSDNEHAGRMGRRAVDDKHPRRPREPALPVLASPGRACRRLVQVAIPGPRRPPMSRPLSPTDVEGVPYDDPCTLTGARV